MQTDLAENLQEFNSIETERNAIYLLTRLAHNLGARGAGGAGGGTGGLELACQVEKSGITRSNQATATARRPSSAHRQLVCPETEEAIEVTQPSVDCQEKKPQIATRGKSWKIGWKSGREFERFGGNEGVLPRLTAVDAEREKYI